MSLESQAASRSSKRKEADPVLKPPSCGSPNFRTSVLQTCKSHHVYGNPSQQLQRGHTGRHQPSPVEPPRRS